MLQNTGQEFDGSDSGARPDEAVSWGKIKGGVETVKVGHPQTAKPTLAHGCYEGLRRRDSCLPHGCCRHLRSGHGGERIKTQKTHVLRECISICTLLNYYRVFMLHLLQVRCLKSSGKFRSRA